jgi:hypothetical protein
MKRGIELGELRHEIDSQNQIIAMQEETIERLVTNRERVKNQLKILKRLAEDWESAYRAELAKPPRIRWRTVREEAPPVETEPCDAAAHSALRYLKESGVLDEVDP